MTNSLVAHISVAEVRSSGEQHANASRLLRDVVAEVPAEVIRSLNDVIQAKFEYEYSGEVFTQAAAKRLLRKAERFYTWADDQLY